jgi:hypothetical protein
LRLDGDDVALLDHGLAPSLSRWQKLAQLVKKPAIGDGLSLGRKTLRESQRSQAR